MAGKYAKLNLPAFQLEPSYQEKIDLIRDGKTIIDGKPVATGPVLRGMPPGELGKLFKTIEAEIDVLEDEVKAKKSIKEALSQEMLAAMEDDDLSSFKLADGTLLYSQQEPYCSVKDKKKWLGWITKQKLTDFLSVNFQTMNGLIKERLIKGETVPPGIEVFMKSSVRMRKG